MNENRPLTPRAPISLNPKPNKSGKVTGSRAFDMSTVSKVSQKITPTTQRS